MSFNHTVEFRLIVQRDSVFKEKYYPKVLSAQTDKTFPWSVPTANILIETNTLEGTSGFISPIRVDDIIRLQVNETWDTEEKSVWIDLFEGRIMSIDTVWNGGNTTTLTCRGHDEECLYTAVDAAVSRTSEKTGVTLDYLFDTFTSRITGETYVDKTLSTTQTNYNIAADSKYLGDAISELETLEDLSYIFKTVPAYDSENNLSGVEPYWQPVPTGCPISAIENTHRLINAKFKSSASNLVNDVTIYGDGVSGTYADATSKTTYNDRYHTYTDTSITAAAQCTALATAIVTKYKDPLVSGTITMMGSILDVGDYIYCRIPSLEVDGSTIDGSYRVRRVTHSISSAGWLTSIDVGDVKRGTSDIQLGLLAANRLNNMM